MLGKIRVATVVAALGMALLPLPAQASHGPSWAPVAQTPYQFTAEQMSFRGYNQAASGVSRILIRMYGQKQVGGSWMAMFSWDDCSDCVAYNDADSYVYHSFTRFCAGLAYTVDGWNWVRTRAKGMVRVGSTWDDPKYDNSNGANMKC